MGYRSEFKSLTAAGATGAGLATNVDDMTTAAFQITGVFVATVTFQGSVDGTNYVSLLALNLTTKAPTPTSQAPGIYQANVAGLKSIRLNVTAFTSGTVTGFIKLSTAEPAEADAQVAPGQDTLTVVPSDTVDLAGGVARGLFVGVAGNITLITPQGTTQLFSNVPVGTLSVSCTRVEATGTTATNMVALY